MKKMICVCGYKGEAGNITNGANGIEGSQGNFIARIPNEKKTYGFEHLGSVDLFVCPHCGLIYSNLNGTVDLNKERFEKNT